VIVTVTCNPAIDVTYRVGRLCPGEVHRVTEVSERPGGKAVNVARVLHQLGAPVVATGLADHDFGPRLESIGIATAFVPALPSVRRTVVVHAEDGVTGLWEPGPRPQDPSDAERLLVDRVDTLLTGAVALVVSGSLPEGVDPALPVRLADTARAHDVPVVLDLDDEPLRRAGEGSGAVLMPNLDELRRLVGSHDADLDVVRAAEQLSARTGAPVVVTLGAQGMVAVAGGTAWHSVLPEPVRGNPTGAGDAATAAVARGLSAGRAWPELLPDAVALSAAAVVSPVAGEVDFDCYRAFADRVALRTVDVLVPERGTP
jgi:tagatose 6-phosphate kinase